MRSSRHEANSCDLIVDFREQRVIKKRHKGLRGKAPIRKKTMEKEESYSTLKGLMYYNFAQSSLFSLND